MNMARQDNGLPPIWEMEEKTSGGRKNIDDGDGNVVMDNTDVDSMDNFDEFETMIDNNEGWEADQDNVESDTQATSSDQTKEILDENPDLDAFMDGLDSDKQSSDQPASEPKEALEEEVDSDLDEFMGNLGSKEEEKESIHEPSTDIKETS